jgi:hypothetical protein
MRRPSARVKAPVLDKDIAKARQALFGHPRNQFLTQQVEIGLASIGIFGWNQVSAQEGGHNLQCLRSIEPLIDLELLEFIVQVQPVTGFGLYRGHAEPEHRVQRRAGLALQVAGARAAGCRHGANDAAAGRGDFLVAGALQARLELVAAPAAEAQVGVAIDKARNDQASPTIDHGLRTEFGGQLTVGPDPFNPLATPGESRLADQPGIVLCVAGRAGGQFGDVAQDGHGGGGVRSRPSLARTSGERPDCGLDATGQIARTQQAGAGRRYRRRPRSLRGHGDLFAHQLVGHAHPAPGLERGAEVQGLGGGQHFHCQHALDIVQHAQQASAH